MKKQLVIIGGGPAGLAAAVAARKAGLKDILILERDQRLGGILNQCIHNGFGLHTFHEELTGPEYAQRFIDQVQELSIPVQTGTMVLEIGRQADGGKAKTVTCVSREQGLQVVETDAVILAMGCRERPRGALNIPGYRPAGIYSAGTAQKLVNIDGKMPGKNVVILGSGDIGLIMARRMMLEGARVQAVAEVMPYSGGLKRNIVQCLDDFQIPLLLSHTVTEIRGRERVEGVTIMEVDENRRPVPGTEQDIVCDTLLLSCGLIPENELSRAAGIELSPITQGPVVNESLETSLPGVFAAGNVLHVHDLVDFVSQEAGQAGEKAAAYVLGKEKPAADGRRKPGHEIQVETGGIVRYTVPARIDPEKMNQDMPLRFRVSDVLRGGYVNIRVDDRLVLHRKRLVMAPGEMETVNLKREWIPADAKRILVETEAV